MIDHDRIAEVYEGTVGSREFQEVSRRRIHWMCAQVTGRDVLDVGCSQGIASILLGREGHRVVGIDREHEPIRAARERLDQEEPHVRERVEFLLGEAGDLSFPDASFDAVLLGELLEHQLDPTKPLDEARRVLRPGGRIVITTPYGTHPYPDHKDPVYLTPLLEKLEAELSIAEIALVDRYVGVVAERAKKRAPRVWRRALGVAEQRLADQDQTMDGMRGLVGDLRERTRELERSLQDQDLTRQAMEIQRDAATERQHELQAELAEAERRAAAAVSEADDARTRLQMAEPERRELVEATARVHELEANRQAATRELERMHTEVRGVRERLGTIEVAHRTALIEVDRAQTQLEETRAAREAAEERLRELEVARAVAEREADALRERLEEASAAAARLGPLEAEKATLADQLLDAHRHLELEQSHRAGVESARAAEAERAAELERQLQKGAAALDAAAAELERIEGERVLSARRVRELEERLDSARRQLVDGRARMAALIAERDEMQEAAASARRKADELEASLGQLSERAAADARSATERTVELEAEIERLRMTVAALTSEGTALRRSLTGVEGELERERKRRGDVEARLEAASERSDRLEQELATIQGRVGYRVGRFFRRPFRRSSRGSGDETGALPAAVSENGDRDEQAGS